MHRFLFTFSLLVILHPQLNAQDLSNVSWKNFTSHYEGKTHKLAAILESSSFGNTQVHIVNDGSGYFLMIHNLMLNTFVKKEDYELILSVSKGTDIWVYKLKMGYSGGTLAMQLKIDSDDKSLINNIKNGSKLTIHTSENKLIVHEFTLNGATAALKAIGLK